MRRLFAVGNRKLVVGLTLLSLLAAVSGVWLERQPLLARYYIWRLARASEGEREAWVKRTASLDGAAVPGLLTCLVRDDARACTNACTALAVLLNRWGPEDGRSVQLLERLADTFLSQSVPGQTHTLELESALLRPTKNGSVPAVVILAAARLLDQAAQSQDQTVHKRCLAQVEAMLTLSTAPEVLNACRRVVHTCLRDGQARTEVQAIRIAIRPEMNCLDQVVPLLNDSCPEVRQTAMLAVGDAPSAIATDDLLQWLHDPDQDVRRLCEEALLWSRHLPQKHLRLGRLLTDGRPEVRLQVLDCLQRDPDLEPGIWLRRLSHDPSPAVRAAAARVAAAEGIEGLSDRLEQMAESDPSPTVRQLARHYRTRLQGAAAAETPP